MTHEATASLWPLAGVFPKEITWIKPKRTQRFHTDVAANAELCVCEDSEGGVLAGQRQAVGSHV